MGTVAITIDAGTTGTATRTFTLTNANIGRIATLMKAQATALNPEAPALTTNEALNKWADWVMQATKDAVQIDERRQAAITEFGIT